MHEVAGDVLRGFGADRVLCSCGESFWCWVEFEAHAEAARGGYSLDGPGSVPWAVELLRAAVARGVTDRGAAAVAAFLTEWEAAYG